ncbi:hypothetical protein PVAP13_3NG268800 [Panicum virgatum]|uniref:Uncharacterized protein n=1 Tax=Panicum virgatum TaxID=38727 RepID=A0A8T0UCH6_PANVG|nr:hypothetical protein PVAP13_3NG268800 [Panicum virgatum]
MFSSRWSLAWGWIHGKNHVRCFELAWGWCLMRHFPLVGIVLGYLHAHNNGSLISLWLVWVVVVICITYLCSIDASSPYSLVLRLLRRMLCRRCVGGCFAASALLVLRMLCRPCYSYSN